MSIEKKSTTIKTELFDYFTWKRLPIEHEYITIVFCLEKYRNIDNSDDFMKNIEQENIKKAIKYILNIMPYQCIINIDRYISFKEYKEETDDKDLFILKLDKLENILNDNENNINEYNFKSLKDKIQKINNKKTYLFTYTNNQTEKTIENSLKNMLDISINSHFNETHKVCIGEIKNIPKNILCVADYIFFENKDVLNEYLELLNHNIRIKTSNTPLYLLDKCNYEYYQLFSFYKHLLESNTDNS